MIKTKYSCIIVDDEPIATRILKGFLDKLDFFEIKAIFHNAVDTISFLQDTNIDLIFLDIQMPGITGIDFLKSLKNAPHVIFTTAYREYAVDAFDLSVVDYLVKPISFDRFLKAVNKFMDLHKTADSIQDSVNNKDYIILKSDKKNYKTFFRDIRYIESMDDYIKVHTTQHTLICYLRLSGILKELPSNDFIRIHRSFIVSTNHITAFTAGQVELGDTKLTIGRNFKDEVLEKLNK